MHAKLIDHMGSDLTVVNAARVSFKNRHDKLDPEKDTKLINYLAEHDHWTPFAHCMATFHIKVPIFVANQLKRHQIGLALNEVSRRYVNDEPEFYWPDDWRLRPDNIKQGSGDEVLDGASRVVLNLDCRALENAALTIYKDMNDMSVAPELARMILPQNMYTEWYWTGSLAAFARICKQRLDPHAQKETREMAIQISEQMEQLFPVSWKALLNTVPDRSPSPGDT